MNPEKFTQKTMALLGDAQSLALKMNHARLDVVHLLVAFMEDSEGYGARLLEAAGGNGAKMTEQARTALGRLPQEIGRAHV